MSKLHKEIQIHIPCPACGKTERVRLKWAEKHKSMKCRGCKGSVDLRINPARSIIARASAVVSTFEKAMEALHAEAKRDGKLAKAHRKASKKAKKGGKKAKPPEKAKAHKQAARKRAPRKAPVLTPLLPEPGVNAGFTV
jgi:transcription elongation factor Elf1